MENGIEDKVKGATKRIIGSVIIKEKTRWAKTLREMGQGWRKENLEGKFHHGQMRMEKTAPPPEAHLPYKGIGHCYKLSSSYVNL